MRRLLSVLLLTCFAFGCSHDRPTNGSATGTPLGKPAKPNIIYILADDLGYGDLGSYGQQKIATPTLDRLARHGMRFTDHYAGSTVCAPSRCVLMTGKHAGRCFMRGNYHDKATGYTIAMPADEPSLPRLLKSAGYSTACVGKWGLGPPASSSDPNTFGFDFFYGFLDQRHAHNHYPDYLWRNDKRELTGNVMTDESRVSVLGAGVAVKRVAYANDLFFKESQRWIAEQAKQGRPFFLYLALTVPHANNEANRLVRLMPEDARDQRGQEVPDFGPYADKDWTGPNKGQAAMITRFDAQIGEMVKQLESLGLAEDTLIVFTSDNGPHAEGGNDPAFFDANGPLRGIKRDLYEGGIRVPMIAYWPGTIAAGYETDHISSFQDVLPTFADLAGVRVPEGVTGISFAPSLLKFAEGRFASTPLWDREEQRPHKFLYWEFFEQRGKQAVRMGKWKGVRLNVQRDKDGPIQLYDLSTDPGETNNIADQHPDVVAEIDRIMSEAHTMSAAEQWRYDWEK
ncbi:MAG: arylsulfatase [Phycisphaeraceae bacterium]